MTRRRDERSFPAKRRRVYSRFTRLQLENLCGTQQHLIAGMLGLRGSVGKLSDVTQQLLLNISFRGIRIQGIRVGGSDIPDNKRLAIALQSVHGVGRARAKQILSELNIDNKLTRELTGKELNSIRELVANKYVIAEDLRRRVRADIERLVGIQCYRGIRHQDGLPCRGQRTHTNARTAKSRKSPRS